MNNQVHVVLAARLDHAQDYIHKLGLNPRDCRTVVTSIESDTDRLRGLTRIILHRTQSWYRAPWNRPKAQIRDMIQVMHSSNRIVAILNEVDVVNTTFMS